MGMIASEWDGIGMLINTRGHSLICALRFSGSSTIQYGNDVGKNGNSHVGIGINHKIGNGNGTEWE